MGAELKPLMVQILMDFFRAYSVKRVMVRYKKDNAWIIRVRAGRILMLTVQYIEDAAVLRCVRVSNEFSKSLNGQSDLE
jgi:hypothetical protein